MNKIENESQKELLFKYFSWIIYFSKIHIFECSCFHIIAPTARDKKRRPSRRFLNVYLIVILNVTLLIHKSVEVKLYWSYSHKQNILLVSIWYHKKCVSIMYSLKGILKCCLKCNWQCSNIIICNLIMKNKN